jgi:hypothetical protein
MRLSNSGSSQSLLNFISHHTFKFEGFTPNPPLEQKKMHSPLPRRQIAAVKGRGERERDREREREGGSQ